MEILVTGGAGYIGSHACVELLQAGHNVIVVDSLANSDEESLRRVQNITGKSLEFIEADIADKLAMQGSLISMPLTQLCILQD